MDTYFYEEVRTLSIRKDHSRIGNIEPVYLRRGENGVTRLTGNLLLDGLPAHILEYKAQFKAFNARKQWVIQDALIESEGVVSVVIDSNLTAYDGEISIAYFELNLGNMVLTSDSIPIVVLENVDITEEEAKGYRNKIDELFEELEKEIDAELESVREEELQRQANELKREANEHSRNTAEYLRDSAETSRLEAEEQRANQEDTRRENEDKRVLNETVREESEAERSENELLRKVAEELRVEAEDKREFAEVEREQAERNRNSEESKRQYFENERKSNEVARQLAEEQRQANYEALKQDVIDTLDGISDAIEDAENIVKDANASAERIEDAINTAATAAQAADNSAESAREAASQANDATSRANTAIGDIKNAMDAASSDVEKAIQSVEESLDSFKTITGSEVEYQVSNIGTSIPTGSWSKTIPTSLPGQFLWTRTTIHYNKGEDTYEYSAAYQGLNGVAAPTNGMFWLYVEPNGDLYAAYSDESNPPKFEYNSQTGELYCVYDY